MTTMNSHAYRTAPGVAGGECDGSSNKRTARCAARRETQGSSNSRCRGSRGGSITASTTRAIPTRAAGRGFRTLHAGRGGVRMPTR